MSKRVPYLSNHPFEFGHTAAENSLLVKKIIPYHKTSTLCNVYGEHDQSLPLAWIVDFIHAEASLRISDERMVGTNRKKPIPDRELCTFDKQVSDGHTMYALRLNVYIM